MDRNGKVLSIREVKREERRAEREEKWVVLSLREVRRGKGSSKGVHGWQGELRRLGLRGLRGREREKEQEREQEGEGGTEEASGAAIIT